MDVDASILAMSFLDSMNWIDSTIILLVLLCAALGYWSGFVWQTVRLAGLVVALWVAQTYHGPVAARLRGDIPAQSRMIISYGALLLACLIVAGVIMLMIRKPLDAAKPKTTDRLFGTILGAAKGVLVCGVLSVLVLSYTDRGTALRTGVVGSRLSGYCSYGTKLLWEYTPGAQGSE